VTREVGPNVAEIEIAHDTTRATTEQIGAEIMTRSDTTVSTDVTDARDATTFRACLFILAISARLQNFLPPNAPA